jgi:uncharacterized protein YdeI (BOF family)
MSLSKKSKIAVLVFALFAIGTYAVYKYTYKPHKTIDELSVTFSGTADAFISKVKSNPEPWQDVVVELTGTITAIDANGFTLNNSIYCQLKPELSAAQFKTQQDLKIKGRMIGYDDLLEEIKLDQTIIK